MKLEFIEKALVRALRGTKQRAHYYETAKPQMARRIAAKMTKEQIETELATWLKNSPP
jgi:hypothetical protein